MSERAAFISAVLDNPADDTARLVFADWLQENGESDRAEFIRAQIEAANLPDDARAASEPQKRADALLQKHEAAWRAAVGDLYDARYVRGFLNVGAFLHEIADLAHCLAVEPFTVRLRLSPSSDGNTEAAHEWLRELAANPIFAAVVSIDSEGAGFGGELFALLIHSPHLKNLQKITLFEDSIGSSGVQALADSPTPFVLRHLDLNSGIGSPDNEEEEADTIAAVKILATHPRFASLTALGLPFNGIGNECVKLLLASTTLAPDLTLGLGEDNPFSAREYGDRLAKRFKMVDYV